MAKSCRGRSNRNSKSIPSKRSRALRSTCSRLFNRLSAARAELSSASKTVEARPRSTTSFAWPGDGPVHGASSRAASRASSGRSRSRGGESSNRARALVPWPSVGRVRRRSSSPSIHGASASRSRPWVAIVACATSAHTTASAPVSAGSAFARSPSPRTAAVISRSRFGQAAVEGGSWASAPRSSSTGGREEAPALPRRRQDALPLVAAQLLGRQRRRGTADPASYRGREKPQDGERRGDGPDLAGREYGDDPRDERQDEGAPHLQVGAAQIEGQARLHLRG